MSRYRVGMRIRTNYGTGPYVVTKITEGCNCPNFLDNLNLGEKAPKSPPHAHLVCKRADVNDKSLYYLNGYDENLHSVWSNDYLIDLDEVLIVVLLGIM